MIYFTSDPHFDHANVIRFCNRPYADVKEMNCDLIARWNARVTGNDTVYILGDFFYRCKNPEPILRQLKGHKILIEGNHDGTWMQQVDLSRYFQKVLPYLEVSDGAHGLTLCHYPLLTYKHAARNYMIHGHIHNDTSADFWQLLVKRDHVLNAGVDINGYRPVTFEELVENNARWKTAHPGTQDQTTQGSITHHAYNCQYLQDLGG